jgi:ATP-dependent protease HslVU (ClpYQ) peptidase subunit
MTTLAAVAGDGWAVIGYDSQVAEEGGRKYTLPKDAGKLVTNGPYIIGVTGDFRAVNILSHSFEPPEPPKKVGTFLDRFMTSTFIPALKSCFDDNFYGTDNESGAMLLVAVNGVVYEIGMNYDCLRDDSGLHALGTGGAYALGALAALNTRKRTLAAAKRHVTRAVKIAAAYDHNSSEPVHLVVQEWSPPA